VKECTGAFEEAKKILVTAPALVHHDPSLLKKMTGDPSAYGIGALITRVYPDESE